MVIFLISIKPHTDNKEHLILHVQSCHLPLVQYLIENGSNIEAKDKDQCTLLHFGCEFGSQLVVQYLIANGSNIEAKEKDQMISLHIECLNCFLPKCSISHLK